MTSASATGVAVITRPLAGLLLADVISTAGSEMTAVALPWFVLVSTGSPTQMGAVLAAEFAGMTVLGLAGGRAVTTVGPRRMMLASDVLRAVLIGSIPLLYGVGVLSVPIVVAVGFLVGAFFPAYSSSQRMILAELVHDDELRLTRVGGLMGSVNETASFVGPALAGVLIALIGPTRVLLVDAASYLTAFLLVAGLVPRSRAAGGAERGGIVDGLRYLAHNRSLRAQVIGIGFVEIGWTALMATLPVLALRSAGGPSLAGWLVAAYGGGSVVGGLISSRARSVGGTAAAWALAGIAVASWVLPLPVPVWVVAGAVAAFGLFSGLFFPRFFSALTAGTPPRKRATVMTAVTIATSLPAPVGFLAAGFLSQHVESVTPSMLLVAVTATLGALIASRGLSAAGPRVVLS